MQVRRKPEDGLRGAEWILAAYPFELGGLPVAWQLSARGHAASAMPEWNACFTSGVSYEALADLLLAIDAREAPDIGFEGPETVLDGLSVRGWIRDVDRPRTTATDPGFSSCVSLEMMPPFIEDADPRPDLVGWQAWAEPVPGAPYLWCASFSASVPHGLVAAFASSRFPGARASPPQAAPPRDHAGAEAMDDIFAEDQEGEDAEADEEGDAVAWSNSFGPLFGPPSTTEATYSS